MKPFEYVAPRGLEEAGNVLVEGAALKGGGVDLLDLMKEGVTTPSRVIALGAVVEARIVTGNGAGGAATMRIGGGATLAQIGSHPDVAKQHAALAEAAREAATPQVRNQATLAGNLLQRSRCLYFRLADFPCRKKGGEVCYVQAGEQHYSGVFATGTCPAVHPSNTAVPLVAAGAQVILAKGGKERTVDLEALFVGPGEDVSREHRLEDGEVLTTVLVPRGDWKSGYYEVRQRRSADWALVSAAAYLRMEGDKIAEARVAMGFVAPMPLRLPKVDAALAGGPLTLERARAAAELAFEGAEPLAGTRYKIPMGKACLVRAILAAGGMKR